MGFPYVPDVVFACRKWTQPAVRGAAPDLAVLVQMAEPIIAVAIEQICLFAIFKEAHKRVQVIFNVIPRRLFSIISRRSECIGVVIPG